MEDYVSEAYAKVTYAGEKIRFQSLHIAHIYLVMSEHFSTFKSETSISTIWDNTNHNCCSTSTNTQITLVFMLEHTIKMYITK